MKGLARTYVWWPDLDNDIERVTLTGSTCQQTRNNPPQAPVHAWEYATKPWSRLHVDFADSFKGKSFLLVVHSFSKWLEVRIVHSTSESIAVRELWRLFAMHGLPHVVASDNRPGFASEEFRTFYIRQAQIAPHLASNGQAERMVQETKSALKRLSD
ncbi:uncharacterized protein K02A2.6-like [Ornithodoros turicata]|uniref:uncharacterized protein K02A2.6-like n=1 Tax=Ornithodoros turicata TaxID=34597 RepID=UPI0031395F29